MSSTDAPTPRPEVRTAVLVAVGWVACTVAVGGFVSLLTDREVMPVASAGPLAAPVGLVVAAVLIGVLGARATRSRLLPVLCGLTAWAGLLAGSAAVALLDGGPAAALRLLLRTAAGPFVLADAVLAVVAGAVMLLAAFVRDRGQGRARWPWEGRDGS